VARAADDCQPNTNSKKRGYPMCVKQSVTVFLGMVLFFFVFCSKNNKNSSIEGKNSEIPISENDVVTRIDSIRKIQDDRIKHLPSINPVLHGEVIQSYQEKSEKSKYIYISSVNNTDVFATGDGKVLEIAENPGSKLKSITISHSKDYTTIYSNLTNIKVKVGQVVHRWDVIGNIGGTAQSSKPFLKYEILNGKMNVNPLHFMLN
jgi:murein DD-endopeptidase MepM/ murein hydrolase activator NlpD